MAVLPLVLAGPELNVRMQGTDSISEGLELKRSVRETDNNCSEGLYQVGPFCCQPCQPGERKVKDCTTSGGAPTCHPCTEGEEYTDRKHYSDKCRRCAFCDEGHGLEVETNCTRTQNTKCRCKENFYCNASLCDHCYHCTSCGLEDILEPCTRTSNTKCKKQSSNYKLLWLLILPGLAILFVFIYKRYRKRQPGDPESGIPSPESVPMNVSDVNLNKYIWRTAEKMKICDAKKFARQHKIPESKIDEIEHNSPQDAAEQKIQLLQCWYQSHGKTGACQALIQGLRKANRCDIAEEIQAMVWEDHENSISNSRNENEGQSLE